MRYRILVVGALSAEVGAVFRGHGEPRFAVSETPWEDFAPANLCGEAPNLVVFVPSQLPVTETMIEWLARGAGGVPTIAACPPGYGFDGALLDHVDDFVAATEPQELFCRALRLLRATTSEAEEAGERLGEQMALRQLVGSDPAFLAVLRQIALFARTQTSILITGETGTGKELCARALHHLGPRRNLPFVAVNCGSVPDHLFENEMFGHTRGAYTDAVGDQKGLVSLADRGTLFLDEVDSLSLPAQGKLLRFLQEQSFRPLGCEKFLRADVHVLAATNSDLEATVRRERFRADLYYRLNVLQIRMPPLRERRADIPELARHFLQIMADKLGVKRRLAQSTLRKLIAYDWPGNVRELSNLVQRAAVLAPAESVLPCHVMLPGTEGTADSAREWTFRGARRLTIETFERTYVKSILDKHEGNITRAAREADYERRAFGRLARKYKLLR